MCVCILHYHCFSYSARDKLSFNIPLSSYLFKLDIVYVYLRIVPYHLARDLSFINICGCVCAYDQSLFRESKHFSIVCFHCTSLASVVKGA